MPLENFTCNRMIPMGTLGDYLGTRNVEIKTVVMRRVNE